MTKIAMNPYTAMKLCHLFFVVTTFVLFNLRFGLRLALPHKPLPRFLHILPHINDTLLLLSGISLIIITHYIPFENANWLGLKLILLVVYIVIGAIALKSVPRSGRSLMTYVLALLCFLSMALLADFKPLL